jgi:hypothetical protein
MVKTFFFYLSGVIALGDAVFLIIKIGKKKSRPNIVALLTMAVQDSALSAIMLYKRTYNPQIVVSAATFWSFLLLLHYGYKEKFIWTKIDKFFFAVSIVGLAPLAFIKNPAISTIGVVYTLGVVFIGTLSFIMKPSQDDNPDRHEWMIWAIAGISAICALISVKEFSVDAAGQPVVFLLTDILLVITFLRLRKKKPSP